MTSKKPVRRTRRASASGDDAFRLLFLSHPTPMWIYDLETLAFLAVNDAAVHRYGYSRDEFLAMTIKDICPPEDVPRLLEIVAQAPEGLQESGEWRHRFKDGRIIDATITSHKLPFNGRHAKLVSAVNVSDRRRAEARIQQLNRVYAVLGEVNQAIVRIREPQALFEEACRIAVERGGFRMAWIGLVDDASGEVRVAAHAGVTDGYLEKLHVVLGDVPRGRGPTGTAARAGALTIVHDIAQDRRMAPWREDALRLGFRSSGAWPLRVGDEVRGTFSLYAAEPGAFDVEEVALLDELALDLSFAMEFAEKDARRRHAEEALSREGDTLQRIAESSPIGITFVDREGRISYANARAEDILGLTRDEITDLTYNAPTWGITDYEGKPFPDSELPFRRVMETGLPVRDVRHAIEYPDGRRVLLSINAAPLVTAGQVDGMVATIEDVTERRRTEEALRQSEERYRRFFDLSLTGNYLSSTDGTLIACNPAYAAMLGFASVDAALSAPTVSVYATPDERRAFLERLAREQVLRNHESQLIRHDGKPIQVVENAVGIFDAEGRLQQLQGFLFDITERKRAEDALRQKERLLSESQRIANLGSWAVDLDTLRLSWSDEMYRIFGVSPGDPGITTEAFLERIHPDHLAAMQEWIRACGAGEGPADLEFRIVRPDGDLRWVLGRGTLEYDAARRPVLVVGTAQDITERTQLEAQLRQAQKMESVGQLAGGIAHDFNNLLTVINSYSELALAALKEGDPLREDLGQIRTAGGRAAELTRQLLAFSRKQVLQPVVLDLNTLVATTEKMLRRLIGEDVDLALRLAQHLGSVTADPGQVEQVIVNLVVNARDAMPTGGKLTIETGDVDLDEAYASQHPGARAGPYVMLAISDTGTGMDAATRARIFEPFFTTKEVGRGTGLGLSTVYGIVKQSGGYIWVYSEIGVGTTFRVYLPRVAEAAHEVGAVPAQSPARGTETVLIVEDEGALRRAAGRILASAGYTVLEAADGAEAVRMLAGHTGPLHLLLTDMIMPQMGGPEVAERVRALRPGIKVLFSSGYADDAFLRHGTLDPGVQFIAKPYSAQALMRKVREVLDAL